MAKALTVQSLDGAESAVVRAVLRSVQRPMVKHAYRQLSAAEIDDIVARPHVAAAIAQAVRQRLVTDCAPAAVQLLDDVMRDTAQPAKLRVEAANSLLDRSGFAKAQVQDAPRDDRPLRDRSPEELREMANRIELELADRAHVIIDGVYEDTQQDEELQELLG